MSFFKTGLFIFLSISVAVLTACGSINGSYTQMPAPFESENSTVLESSPSESVSDSSSNDSNNNEPDILLDINFIVRVRDYIPDIKVDIKYATNDNFTKGRIYNFDDAYLRYGTVIKLKKAVESLKAEGYNILIWDGFRPHEAQIVLFENTPDGNFVSDPKNGFTSHSKGGTVDLTLVKADGSFVEMPSDFDEFTEKADRNYDDVSNNAAENSKILEKAMTDAGFKGYSKEWWHYSDTDSYSGEDIKDIKPLSKSKTAYIADCSEYITLRKSPDNKSEAVAKIPANAEFKAICWYGNFVGVSYENNFGFVSSTYVK